MVWLLLLQQQHSLRLSLYKKETPRDGIKDEALSIGMLLQIHMYLLQVKNNSSRRQQSVHRKSSKETAVQQQRHEAANVIYAYTFIYPRAVMVVTSYAYTARPTVPDPIPF